jgi:general nucleoside transport system permease protein
MLEFIFSTTFLVSSVTYAMPIIFASLAALISNKAGTININVEGSMSLAAMAGALASFYSHSWMVGLLAAILVGILMSLVLAACTMLLRVDTILAGIALNTFCSGLAVVVLFAVLGVQGDTSSAPSMMIPTLRVPLLADIPVIGQLLFGENLMVYLAVLSLLLTWFILNKTRLGAHIKAVGYHAEAARGVGIQVNRTRMAALVLCGAFAGLGGAFLSMVYLSYFSVGMVAGRGFIGLAAEAMGAGNPFLTVLFAWLFGAVDYFAVGAQSVLNVPYELLNTLPYLMTVIALVVYSLRTARASGRGRTGKHQPG